jgi:hypothetical protein
LAGVLGLAGLDRECRTQIDVNLVRHREPPRQMRFARKTGKAEVNYFTPAQRTSRNLQRWAPFCEKFEFIEREKLMEEESKPVKKEPSTSTGMIVFATLISIIVVLGFLFLWSNIQHTSNPSVVTLDFQNKSGVVRLRSSFTDILVSSEGSTKKGNGYLVSYAVINPSSVGLKNITSTFSYNKSRRPVICSDINTIIYGGYSKKMECFISDLSDYDLKAIEVSIHFEEVSFHR